MWRHRRRRVWQLSRAEWWLLVEANCWLGLARLAVLIIPLRCIAPHLGHHMQESSIDDDPKQRATVMRIAWTIRTMRSYAPWTRNCLAQAIAAKRMLQRRHIPCTLYLGVAKNATDGLHAHAWLRSGPTILTGAHTKDHFTVVATFAETSR